MVECFVVRGDDEQFVKASRTCLAERLPDVVRQVFIVF